MKILITTDGSDSSFAAAKLACKMLTLNKITKIKIICAAEEVSRNRAFSLPLDYTEMMQKALWKIAENIVEDLKQELHRTIGKTDITIETVTISGEPKKAIIEEAENWDADLIVVGSYGKGFWKRLLLGSVSNSVVKQANCSVFVGRNNFVEQSDQTLIRKLNYEKQ